MELVEGQTYKFKPLCELNKHCHCTPDGGMDYLAETTITAKCVYNGELFRIDKRYSSGQWVIYSGMLEEICDNKLQSVIVISPTSRLSKHVSEEDALDAISDMIEAGGKGVYKMYQLYQEVETPKLDLSSMIRKIVDKILPKGT